MSLTKSSTSITKKINFNNLSHNTLLDIEEKKSIKIIENCIEEENSAESESKKEHSFLLKTRGKNKSETMSFMSAKNDFEESQRKKKFTLDFKNFKVNSQSIIQFLYLFIIL